MAEIPDKNMCKVISSSHDPLVVIPGTFDISQMSCIRTCRNSMATLVYSLNSISLDPSGKFVAAAFSDCTVKVWDATTGRFFRTLTGHTFTVSSVTWDQAENCWRRGV